MGEIIQLSRVGSTGSFVPSELAFEYTNEQSLLHNPELYKADTLVDRQAVERQAQELIDARSSVETEYKTEQTYLNDARTLLFEALTASGHLSRIEIQGALSEIHSTMLRVLLNSYSEALPEHEKKRRFQEICEELTIQQVELKIAQGEISPSTEVATISDYIDEASLNVQAAQSIGYRPQNKKGMVRSSRLVINHDGTYTRVSEQISRSNADAKDTLLFFAENNITTRLGKQADVAVLSTQLIHEYQEGVVGLQRRLDLHKGLNVRYGESAHEQQISYEDLRLVSAERERVAECYISKLAQFTQNLDTRLSKGDITRDQHQEMFKTEVHRILEAICVLKPEYARACFGEATEAGFVRASNLTAAGDYEAASREISHTRPLESTVTFCGMSITAEQAKSMGVDSTASLLQLGRENWNKTMGKCRVENCLSPKPTEVGGCSVCLGGCQPLFDRGMSYQEIVQRYGKIRKEKMKKVGAFATRTTKPGWTLEDLFKTKSSSDKNLKHEKIAA